MNDLDRRRWRLMLVLIVAIGTAARVAASINDLWLDEVWSLHLAMAMRSAWDVFNAEPLRQDNNHPLNTLLLWLMQSVKPEWLLRLPSVIAGTAMVAIAAWWGCAIKKNTRAHDESTAPDLAPQSQWIGLFAAALLSGSYLMVQYGSEARGYSMALAAALLAALAMWRGAGRQGWRWPVTFWMAVILGALAQPIFIAEAFVPLGFWSLWLTWDRVRRNIATPSPLRVIGELARWHALPSAFLYIYFTGFLSHLVQAGGSTRPWTPALANLLGLSVGVPMTMSDGGAALSVRIALGSIAGIVALNVLWRAGRRDACAFYLLVIPGGAALQLALTRPTFLYERYLIISAMFFTLLIAHALATLAARGRRHAMLTCCIVGVMLAGHIVSITHLLRDGRGQYTAALQFIVAASPSDGQPIRIASDHDTRNPKLILHFHPHVSGSERLVYVEQRDLTRVRPDWFLAHSLTDPRPPANSLTINGQRYELRAVFTTAPLSGFHWFVLQRTTDPNRP